MYQFLIRMFASSVRGNVHDRSFQHFEQALLHSFTAHIAGDGHVLGLTGNLIDLIDEDDTSLRFLHIIIGILQQSYEQGLHIFSHIPGLCQRGSIADSEGHLQHFGDCAGEQGLTGTGGTDEQDIRFLDLHIIVRQFLQHPFVMVVNGYGQEALGFILADDIQVQELFDLLRCRQRVFG